MSKDPRQNRRPPGTPAGGQFAPTNRPEAEVPELIDDDIGQREPAEPSVQLVELGPSVLDDAAVEIERILGDESRDGELSPYWDDETWRVHVERLLHQAYEEVAVTRDGDRLHLELARPHPGPMAGEIEACLQDLGVTPVRARAHTNPDGSTGGLVAETATVDETAWVAPGARVLDNAHVIDAGRVLDEAVVRDEGIVAGNAVIAGTACVHERGCVLDHAVVADRAEVSGDAVVCSAAMALDRAKVTGQALVSGYARIRDDTVVAERSVVTGYANCSDFVQLRGVVRVAGEAVVSGRTVLDGERVLAGCEVA